MIFKNSIEVFFTLIQKLDNYLIDNNYHYFDFIINENDEDKIEANFPIGFFDVNFEIVKTLNAEELALLYSMTKEQVNQGLSIYLFLSNNLHSVFPEDEFKDYSSWGVKNSLFFIELDNNENKIHFFSSSNLESRFFKHIEKKTSRYSRFFM